jgi:type I restriction enzyme R subunit
MIFDGEQLTTLLAPLEVSWRDRTQKELALMADLVPLLKKRAAGREITGLSAYEHTNTKTSSPCSLYPGERGIHKD